MILFTNLLNRWREWRIGRDERLSLNLYSRMKKVAGSK